MKPYQTVSLIMVLTIASCTKKTASSDLPLHIHLPLIRFSLDPHRMEDMYSMSIVLQLFRGLFRYNAQGDVLPDLVESWTVSSDRRNYRFYLRMATFSNGDPILAKHVVNSLARIFYLNAAIGADLEYISGATRFKMTKTISDFGLKAKNDHEVELQLEHPSALILKHLAVVDCAVLPINEFDQEFKVNARTTTSGPYHIAALSNSSVTLLKWRPDRLDSKRPPTRIEYSQTKQTAIDVAAKGLTDSLDFELVNDIDQKPLIAAGWKQSVTELVKSWFLVMNPRRVPKAVRRHFYERVHSMDLAMSVGERRLRPAYGLIPSGMPGALAESPALEPDTLNGPVELSGNFALQFQEDSSIAVKISNYLKRVAETEHLTLSLAPMTKAEYLKTLFAGTGQLLIGAKGIDYYDGYSELTYFRSGYDGNYFHVNSHTVDQELDDVASLLSTEGRTERYQEIQRTVLKQLTVVPLLFGSLGSGLWSPRVKSIPAHPIGIHGLPLETLEMK